VAVQNVPFRPRHAARGMVVAADQLAATAGVEMLGRGGSAADAAVAAAVVMATTSPHLCGLGGDVLAMVSPPAGDPLALLAIGRAGSGADASRLRGDGHAVMPLRRDVRSVTVPGAVDGWLALHGRFGRLPLGVVLAPAIGLAVEGFAASRLLAAASSLVADLPGAGELCPDGPLQPAQLVRLPGVARTLRAVEADGRDGFYHGEAGRALLELGRGLFRQDDLSHPLAVWADPVRLSVWGHHIWTVPPPSQGYLTAASAWIAERRGLPDVSSAPVWPHLLVEAARAAGHDRPQVLHEAADWRDLVAEDRLEAAASRLSADRAAAADHTPAEGERPEGTGAVRRIGEGDTTHLCAVDSDGLGISLTESNALDFGAHLVAGGTGIFLHNRGLGFSLQPGHPAELGPARRPPHTLSPALVTRDDGTLAHLVGAMGGDGQPQILLQLLARLLHCGEDAASAVASARFVLDAPRAGPFRLWHGDDLTVRLESHAPPEWRAALEQRGHRTLTIGALDPAGVGCAQIISVRAAVSGDGSPPMGLITGAADPRSPEGDAICR
jgi:gamma-glutamyltranspeptidase / glutathione hydrolase